IPPPRHALIARCECPATRRFPSWRQQQLRIGQPPQQPHGLPQVSRPAMPCDGSALNGSSRSSLLLLPSLGAYLPYPSSNFFRFRQCWAVTMAAFVASLFVSIGGGFAVSQQLGETLTALIFQHGVSPW